MALLPTKAFWPKRLFTLFILLSVLHITSLVSAQTITCSKASPCVNNACCSVAVGSTEGVSLPIWKMISSKRNLTRAFADRSSRSADMDLSATLLQLLLVLVTAMQRPNAVNMQRYLERHVLFLPVVQNGVSGKSLSITEIQVICIESSRALLFGQRLSLHAFL